MRRFIAWSLFSLLVPSALRATALHRAYDLQGPGLTMSVAGVGLQGWKGASRSLSIKIDGPVELALLYWAGRDRPCPQEPPGSGVCVIPSEPYKDQVLTLDGTLVLGKVIGGEVQPDANPGAIHNLGFMAEVTEQVRAKGMGRLVFRIGDGEPNNNLADLDGAGLLVISSVPGRPAARVVVFHGLDFAYGEDRTPGAPQIMEPIAFNHGAARTQRLGVMAIFAADALASAPDRIDIGNNPSIVNRLDGSAGAQWDAEVLPVSIPGGSLSTTVSLASEPFGRNPDSLLWVMAALRVPLPVATGCSEGFWASHLDAWKGSGLNPDQLVRSTFVEAAAYGELSGVTLRTALRLSGGSDLPGAVRSLVSEAAAALVNAVHPRLEYPLTRTQVITEVDTALRSHDASTIRDLARRLEPWNGAECPLR